MAIFNYPITIQGIPKNSQDHNVPPLVWRMLGAQPVGKILLHPTATPADKVALAKLFPEAIIDHHAEE